MIKKLIKILLFIILIFIISILYLSIVGIKTDKFNESITNKVLEINKDINLSLFDITFLLNPINFTANITTKNPTILLGSNEIKIKSIKTNVSLKSLIYDEFLLDEIEISTKPIILSDVILLARSFKDSTELFFLDKIIKSGFLVGDIKLKFDDEGKIKENYQINGFIKNVNFNFLNKLNADNLNLNFDISKRKYSLTEMNAEINDVKFSSPSIEINERKKTFSIKGKVLTSKRDFNREQLQIIFNSFFKNIITKKVRFSSENEIFLVVSKKFKFKELNIKSKINLDHLIIQNDLIDLKPYLPNLHKEITFTNHEIIINYDNEKLDIKGSGEILSKDKPDSINYEVIKKNDEFIFDTKTNLKNNKLLIDFLDYEKKEDLQATLLIKGNFKNNNSINFDLISLKEKDNIISFKNLNLSNDFKIIKMESFNFNYLNNNKIKNQLFLTKNNSNYVLKGESFDAKKLINKVMDNDDENSSLFDNFNSMINLNINKVFIDEVNFMSGLSGTLNYKNNKIDNLDIRSFFSNNKTINLSIKTNGRQEKITKLSTDYPKALIKRYNFIKGFDEGFLVYQSVKKDGISNSLLTIDNFKVKEVPAFAKLLSLASLQGIADLLTGEGIRFTDFEMKFSNKKKLTTIEEMYAIGPAVSILMDGYIESKKMISLRGTLVPATTINRSIASIPLLGNILIGKKTGEGVFGVSFKIKGPQKNLKTTVNPIKTLTPRFITRTLEKIKNN